MRNREQFARIIKSRREKLGLRQLDLAEVIGTTEDVIGFYEQARRWPGDEMLAKICRILEMPERYAELMALKHPDHAAIFRQEAEIYGIESQQIMRVLVYVFRQLPEDAQERYLRMMRLELESLEKERSRKETKSS